MNNHKDALDKKAYEHLHDLEVPYEPASWAAMQSRLDALYTEESPAPTDPVDTAVFRALNNMEVGYNAGHWQMMAQRIETIRTLTRRIWSAKISEAAILILALLNWGNLLVEQPAMPAKPTFDPKVPVAEAKPSDSQKDAIALADVQKEGIGDHGKSATETTSSVGFVAQKDGIGDTGKAAMLNDAQQTMLIQDGIGDNNKNGLAQHDMKENEVPGREDYVFPTGIGEKGALESIVDNTAKRLSDAGTEEVVSLETLGNGASPLVAFASLDALPHADFPTVSADVERSLNVTFSKFSKPTQHYVATYASTDRTMISTPYDPISRTLAYKYSASNFGAGVLVGKKKGKTVLETGLGYSSISYEPKQNTSGQRLGDVLDQVDYQAVAIPIRVGRTLGKSKNLSIRAFAGLNVTMLAQADYNYKTYPLSSPDPGGPTPVPSASKKVIGKGVFEGGSLAENTYLNWEASLRFEQTVSANNRWKAFLEPYYQRDFLNSNGTGPNRDRLSNLSLRAGVITML